MPTKRWAGSPSILSRSPARRRVAAALRIGMLRIVEDLCRVSPASTIAPLVVTQTYSAILRHAEVMGDEQHRHAEPLLQSLQQIEHLRLHGHVERGGRFVRDQQVRFVGERHGDHDALALAARELVRMGFEAVLRVAPADQLE